MLWSRMQGITDFLKPDMIRRAEVSASCVLRVTHVWHRLSYLREGTYGEIITQENSSAAKHAKGRKES